MRDAGCFRHGSKQPEEGQKWEIPLYAPEVASKMVRVSVQRVRRVVTGKLTQIGEREAPATGFASPVGSLPLHLQFLATGNL